ncbi:transmembrane protein 170B isoform X2 [Nothoprocta perdicaria]|uniref:transmembrane protein 170B isoform X2 n=1 Tax=Nothoprocta perdicaria TaxID=30464 RepID=UPI000E1BDD66|nr:transmembrane protein 170B isoform X2 [Nothoprocta perdicaria]
MINLSVQQVLSLWAHGTVLRHLTEMWYWVFLWALFSSLFVHGAVGVLMFVMLQRHRQGRLISVIMVSIGFLGSVTGAMITNDRSFKLSGLLGSFYQHVENQENPLFLDIEKPWSLLAVEEAVEY